MSRPFALPCQILLRRERGGKGMGARLNSPTQAKPAWVEPGMVILGHPPGWGHSFEPVAHANTITFHAAP